MLTSRPRSYPRMVAAVKFSRPPFTPQNDSFASIFLSVIVVIRESVVAHNISENIYAHAHSCPKESSHQVSYQLVQQVERQIIHGIDTDRH